MRKAIIIALMVIAAAAGKSVVLTLDAPDTNISGLAWGDGKLWAVDEETDFVYTLNPDNGDVLDSFYVTHSSAYQPTGLAYSETHDLVCVGLWNSYTTGYVYKYTPAGSFQGSVDMCGG